MALEHLNEKQREEAIEAACNSPGLKESDLLGYPKALTRLNSLLQRRDQGMQKDRPFDLDERQTTSFMEGLGRDILRGLIEHGRGINQFALAYSYRTDTSLLVPPLSAGWILDANSAHRFVGDALRAFALFEDEKRSRDQQAALRRFHELIDRKTPAATEAHDSPQGGAAAPADLARDWGTGPEATRQALNRWRRSNAGGDGYIQNTDRRPNEPEFLYQRNAVRHVMEALKNRQVRRTKTSSGRPPKK